LDLYYQTLTFLGLVLQTDNLSFKQIQHTHYGLKVDRKKFLKSMKE